MSKALFFIATVAISAAVVRAQAAPNWQYVSDPARECSYSLWLITYHLSCRFHPRARPSVLKPLSLLIFVR